MRKLQLPAPKAIKRETLHKQVELLVVFIVSLLKQITRYIHACFAFVFVWFFRVLFYPLKIIVIFIYKFFQQFSYELFVIALVIGLLIWLAMPKINTEELAEEAYRYAYHNDIYPFSVFKTYDLQVEELNYKLAKYEAEEEIPLDVMINMEARDAGVPAELVRAIIQQENHKRDLFAVNARNANGTYDAGLMQINNRNFKYCGANAMTIFAPRTNLKCGILLLKDALYNANKLYDLGERRTCTGAIAPEEFRLEFLARTYNGGAGFFKSSKQFREMTCKYASNVRKIVARNKGLIYEEPIKPMEINVEQPKESISLLAKLNLWGN